MWFFMKKDINKKQQQKKTHFYYAYPLSSTREKVEEKNQNINDEHLI